ncbi:hypothetical protein SAMN05216315_111100 [Nitrosospira sp. Nsp18]|nr:hypothetical protein SAMN05216315_111100 [Nitrosospira sp. Nsp18]
MFYLMIENTLTDKLTIALPREPADVAGEEKEPGALCQRQLAALDSNA